MGFLGFLGDVLKIGGGVIGGTITGGPLGGIAGGIAVGQGVLGGQGGGPVPTYPPPMDPYAGGGGFIGSPVPIPIVARQPDRFGPPAGQFPVVPTPGIGGMISRFLPGGSSGYEAAPPGFHINKRYLNYVRASQSGRAVQDPTGQSQVVNVVVRNRQMNPLNPKALRRAIRRQRGMVALMRRTLAGSGYSIKRSGLGSGKRRAARRS